MRVRLGYGNPIPINKKHRTTEVQLYKLIPKCPTTPAIPVMGKNASCSRDFAIARDALRGTMCAIADCVGLRQSVDPAKSLLQNGNYYLKIITLRIHPLHIHRLGSLLSLLDAIGYPCVVGKIRYFPQREAGAVEK